jgi:membrane glycosyltransferase
MRSGAAFPRFVALTLLMSVPLVVGLGAVLAPLEALDVLLVALFALNALWVSAAAATALIAVAEAEPGKDAVPVGWIPKERTAVLFLICGEDPVGVVGRIAEMHRGLQRAGQGDTTDIWLLSDTPASKAKQEESAIAELCAAGALHYRRRTVNLGRKPGNIADWIDHFGTSYTSMLVMDADSAMRIDRLSALRYRMERTPQLALLQSGIAFRPGVTRFARLQRLSARLTGPVFIRGLRAWSGRAGNYWGHNALIRIEAFRAVMRLPRLSGPPPYGGEFLSHDFVEAAFLVRNGWRVEIAPETCGSSEDCPEDLETFHRRDRRWSQGNLQHLRPLFGSRLNKVSRIHLASGVQSYLSSPIWLLLILLFVLAGMAPGAVPVLSGALALLLVPKLAALLWFFRRTERPSRRRTFLRATAAELWLSTLLSPIVMVRQTISVIAVILGQDSGWKSTRRRRLPKLPDGAIEALAGMALVIVAVVGGDSAWQALWLTLIAGPLLAGPWLVPWLDAKAPS